MTKFQMELRYILDRAIPADVLAQANKRRKRRGLMPLIEGMVYRDAIELTTAELDYMEKRDARNQRSGNGPAHGV